MEEPLKDTERLAGLLEACGDYTGPKNGPSSESPSYGTSIPELMEGLSLAESSLAHTLVAFMERVVGLIFVRRHPLARVLESVQTAAYNFLASLYHLLDEAIWLLRSAADSVQLGPGEVPFQALHVSMFDRFKSFRDRCKFVRSSLPGIDATFDSGQTDLVEELKAVGLHYISRILLPLPGGMGAHAALIDDLPAVFSVLKRSARDVVDSINAFEQRILRFRDCFVDLAWVETMVGNPVLVKGMLDVLLSISHEQSRLRESLSDISLAPVGVTTENVLFNL